MTKPTTTAPKGRHGGPRPGATPGPKPQPPENLRNVRVQALLTREERDRLPEFLADLGYPHRRPGEALSALLLDLLHGRANLVRGETEEKTTTS